MIEQTYEKVTKKMNIKYTRTCPGLYTVTVNGDEIGSILGPDTQGGVWFFNGKVELAFNTKDVYGYTYRDVKEVLGDELKDHLDNAVDVWHTPK